MRCASAPTRPGRPAARWSTPSSPHPASTPTTRGRIAPPTWFFFSSRRRHTRLTCDWSSDVCSSDLIRLLSSLDAQYRIWKVFAGALFTDAGMVTNEWTTVNTDDIRPSVGTGLRVLTPFGIGALEYARSEERRVGKECRYRWWREE